MERQGNNPFKNPASSTRAKYPTCVAEALPNDRRIDETQEGNFLPFLACNRAITNDDGSSLRVTQRNSFSDVCVSGRERIFRSNEQWREGGRRAQILSHLRDTPAEKDRRPS